MNCKISVYLAYGMAVYCLACMYYIVMTRNVGTPFRDSLNENQLKIKMESASIRRSIFYQGVAVGLVSMLVLRPFKSC
tara:strand:- start:360 stop:593 length:234 start_codon:yes stop_codon:yes gene_type:complete